MADGERPQEGLAFAVGAVTRGEGGRLAAGSGLTEQQEAFVNHLVTHGGTLVAAAEAAGYSSPKTDGWRLSRNPAVMAAVQSGLARAFVPMAADVRDALGKMATGEVPATGPQVAACRLVLEAAGVIGRGRIAIADDGGKPVGAMSLAEIRAQIAAMAEGNAPPARATGRQVIDV
jgi:phage terminase small subunit